MLAPIIIFVYNRLDYVKNVVASLVQNKDAKDSDVFIFSDGPKNENAAPKVAAVREYLDELAKAHPFQNLTVVKAEQNKGLAKSIIDGVTRVMNEYGKAIIVEDDTVVSKDFLDYMNRGLEYYKADDKIWAIGGYSRSLKSAQAQPQDIYLTQRISSYTWASWKDRWDKVDWEMKYYPKFFFRLKERKQFAMWGDDRPYMLDAQACGKISSWAIRFEYSMMANNMYAILPAYSRAVCNGNDGSGTHSQKANHDFDTVLYEGEKPAEFTDVEIKEEIRQEFIQPFKKSWKRKLVHNWDFLLAYYKKKK